jgi:hypothetical protein
MTELPKSVRDHLARAQAPATPHPDADLLTAYAENSLGAAERQHVTEHVAVCAECREVLFLAQPEVEQAQVVAKPVAARRFAWMAWASVAAVIVVVGSAVVLRQEKVKPGFPTRETPLVMKAEEPKTEEAPKPFPSNTVASDNRTGTRTAANTKKQEEDLAVEAPAIAQSIVPPNKELAAADKKKDEMANSAGVSANEGMQQNVQGVIGGKQIPSGPANTVNSNVTNVYTAQNTAPAAAPAQKIQRKTELARNAAVPSTTYEYSMDAAVRQELGRAHWRISKTGGLERSYVSDDWKPVALGAGVTFRVISVVGDVVWAGGNHGALYVSRNGGIDWAPVKFDSTSDVASIHFDDEVNGKIQTEDGKTWKTADAGNSWTQQ